MKKILPSGSVVLLKESEKRMMIIGYYPTLLEDGKEVTYDYSGCFFPEGVIEAGLNDPPKMVHRSTLMKMVNV